MYKCILFDMDGTLIDSFAGICSAYEAALTAIGRPFPGPVFVRQAIGAPVLQVLQTLCQLPPPEAEKAAGAYRSYYQQMGKKQLRKYDGLDAALARLQAAGYLLGVATLKREEFAYEILRDLGLAPYFSVVCGLDAQSLLTKADLIQRCLEKNGVLPREALLVGDTRFDEEGALKAGVDFLAVTYGYGFTAETCLSSSSGRPGAALHAVGVAHTPAEVAQWVLQRR